MAYRNTEQANERERENRAGHVTGFQAVISMIVTNHDKCPALILRVLLHLTRPIGSMEEVRLLSACSSPTRNLEALTSWMELMLCFSPSHYTHSATYVFVQPRARLCTCTRRCARVESAVSAYFILGRILDTWCWLKEILIISDCGRPKQPELRCNSKFWIIAVSQLFIALGRTHSL